MLIIKQNVPSLGRPGLYEQVHFYNTQPTFKILVNFHKIKEKKSVG